MTIRYLILIAVFSILYACARQTTPNGGPKDLAPPKLLRSTPSNNEKNFKEKILTFYFSEQVKLKEPKEEIIITPEPPKNLFYLAKQNRITIESKTPWKDSTTYSIAFREAIQDITESNPIENLRIAFSTGSIIDSLTLHGKIVDALTSNKDATYNYVQKEFQKKYNIKWLKPIGFNNAYALMMREKQAKMLNIKTISNLKRYLESK